MVDATTIRDDQRAERDHAALMASEWLEVLVAVNYDDDDNASLSALYEARDAIDVAIQAALVVVNA